MCVSAPALAASVSVYIRDTHRFLLSFSWILSRGFSKEPSGYGVKKPFFAHFRDQRRAETKPEAKLVGQVLLGRLATTYSQWLYWHRTRIPVMCIYCILLPVFRPMVNSDNLHECAEGFAL